MHDQGQNGEKKSKTKKRVEFHSHLYRVFSRDVTAAMLVYPTNPLGIELYRHTNVFLCFGEKTRLLTA